MDPHSDEEQRWGFVTPSPTKEWETEDVERPQRIQIVDPDQRWVFDERERHEFLERVEDVRDHRLEARITAPYTRDMDERNHLILAARQMAGQIKYLIRRYDGPILERAITAALDEFEAEDDEISRTVQHRCIEDIDAQCIQCAQPATVQFAHNASQVFCGQRCARDWFIQSPK